MALLSSDECKRIVLLVARPEIQVRAEIRDLEAELDIHYLLFCIKSVPQRLVEPRVRNRSKSRLS